MKKVITYIILLVTGLIFAQDKDINLYEGITSFDKKNYTQAEADFRVSQSHNETAKTTANYNLGNSIYRQNNPSESKYKFANAIKSAQTKEEKHKAYHNLGNVFMQEENYQEAVNTYKNALRNNPYDDETRYNYALAKQKLKENPPQGNDNKDQKGGNDNQDPQNQQDKDKGENNNKQDKSNDKDDKKDKSNDKDDKDKEQGNDKESKQQPKPNGANKQQIENLLEAVNNAEKRVQDKINKKKIKAQPITNDKDW